MKKIVIILLFIPSILLSLSVSLYSTNQVNTSGGFKAYNQEFNKLNKHISISHGIIDFKAVSIDLAFFGSLNNLKSRESIEIQATTATHPQGTGEYFNVIHNCNTKIYSGYIISKLNFRSMYAYSKLGVFIRKKESIWAENLNEEGLSIDCEDDYGGICTLANQSSNSYESSKTGPLLGIGLAIQINRRYSIGYDYTVYYHEKIEADYRMLKSNSLFINYKIL